MHEEHTRGAMQVVTQQSWVRREGSLVAVVVLSLTIVAALAALFPLAIDRALPEPAPESTLSSEIGALATRERLPRQILWTVCGVVLAAAMVLGVALSMLAAWLGFESRGARLVAMGALLLGGAGLFAGIGSEAPGYVLRIYGWLGPGDELMQGLFAAASVFGALGPAYVVVALVGMGFASRLPRTLDAGQLRVRIRLVRAILFTAAVAMVAGTIATLYRLELQIDPRLLVAVAEELPGREAQLASRLSLARTVGIGYGAIYSLFLVAASLPPALLLRDTVWRLSGTAAGSEDLAARRAWIEREGLAVSVAGQLFSILATLAPFLAAVLEGPVVDLLGTVAGK